jgi:cell shape-determining protein MreC
MILHQGKNKQIKDFLEFNENKGTTYTNVQYKMNAMPRRNFIGLSAFMKKLKRFHTNNEKKKLLKPLKQKKSNTNSRSGW